MFRPFPILLSALGLAGALAGAQDHTARPSPSPGMFRSGGKNRIVFDYSEPGKEEGSGMKDEGIASQATPAPTATPTPAPSLPAGTPVSASTPPPEVRATPETPKPQPVISATPEPAPQKQVAAATPAPEPTPEPAVVPESVVVSATPTPEPTPEPAVAAATPTPEAAPLSAPRPPVSDLQQSPAQDIAESARTQPASTPPGFEGALPTHQEDVVSGAENISLTPPEDTAGPSMPPSQSVTVNLIHKLVQRGILTKEDAAGMIKQAEAEAEVARAQAQADMFAVAQIAASQAASEQLAVEQAVGVPSEDDVRVTYIPEPVKSQIKEDIKSELAQEYGRKPLKDISFMPEWVSNLHPYGDLRVRFEGDFYPQGNDATGAFPDFNAINTGAPFDVTGNEFAPQWNADQDRYRFRIRARLGINVEMEDGFSMGFRLATGNDDNPVSTNQSFNYFEKFNVWIDQAYLKWDLWRSPGKNLWAKAGRFSNPFFSTPMIWDDDLQFDGVAGTVKYEILPGFRPFLTGGAFPVYNTALNFPSNQPSKYQSYDKYLFGIQGGLEWEFSDKWMLKFGAAYYYFYNIEGKLSSPYTPLSQDDAGDTDNSRPMFAQKGNTYFPIRNIVPDASNDYGAINQWQYYGLATKFQELALTARLDYNGFEPIQVSLIGEFVSNLAWNEREIDSIAVNNRGAIDENNIDDIFGSYEGSPYAWYVGLRVGHALYKKRWDWAVEFNYRWLGSDAVVDGFNDSDFGLGGTNMQGYTVAAELALSKNVWVRARWMGADSLAGPQFNINILQLDLNGEF